MSNQMNVHSINRENMLAAKVGDVFSGDQYETSLPVDGSFDEPLLDFLRESTTRIGEEDEDLLDEIEQDDLLGVVQEDWNPEAVDDDLGVIQGHLEGPVKERLQGPENLEGEEFPECIPASSPFRAFDVVGWQFFDGDEFDDIVHGVLRAKQATEGSPGDGLLHEDYEEEWDHVIEAWRDGDYDLVLFWWLM